MEQNTTKNKRKQFREDNRTILPHGAAAPS